MIKLQNFNEDLEPKYDQVKNKEFWGHSKLEKTVDRNRI